MGEIPLYLNLWYNIEHGGPSGVPHEKYLFFRTGCASLEKMLRVSSTRTLGRCVFLVSSTGVHVYLTHKKLPPRRTLQKQYA